MGRWLGAVDIPGLVGVGGAGGLDGAQSPWDPAEGTLPSSQGTGDRWRPLPEAGSVPFAGARKKVGGFPGPRVHVLG